MAKRTRTKRLYFTKIHKDAIVEYAATDSRERRSELYITLIQPAFHELVEKITYTYKFTTLPNIEGLKDECKIHLTTILDKFDPAKGSKAFSYFSVITKNWFIHKVKKNARKTRRELHYDDIPKEIEHQHLSTGEQYLSGREEAEFWLYLRDMITEWDVETLKPNEKKVLEAIKILFDNIDSIEIFNKKAIYLYMRELTGLNTKQVVNNLNKFRNKYRTFKKQWQEGEI